MTAGFRALIGQPQSLDQFRAGLARLLEAAERRRPAGGALRGEAQAAAGGGPPAGGEPDLVRRFMAYLIAALNWMGLIGGVAFVALVPLIARRRAEGSQSCA